MTGIQVDWYTVFLMTGILTLVGVTGIQFGLVYF